jgi:hypothetical protein
MRKTLGLLAVIAAAAIVLSACAFEGTPRAGSEPSGPIHMQIPERPVHASPLPSFKPVPAELVGVWTAVEVLGVKSPKVEPSAVQFYGQARPRAFPDSWSDNVACDGCFWEGVYPVFGPGANARIHPVEPPSPFCQPQRTKLNAMLDSTRAWAVSAKHGKRFLTFYDSHRKRIGVFVLRPELPPSISVPTGAKNVVF